MYKSACSHLLGNIRQYLQVNEWVLCYSLPGCLQVKTLILNFELLSADKNDLFTDEGQKDGEGEGGFDRHKGGGSGPWW